MQTNKACAPEEPADSDSTVVTAPAGAAVVREYTLPPSVERLLTREECAYALSISLRTMAEMIAKGNIPVVRIGDAVRIRPAALNDFVMARESRYQVKKRKKKPAAKD